LWFAETTASFEAEQVTELDLILAPFDAALVARAGTDLVPLLVAHFMVGGVKVGGSERELHVGGAYVASAQAIPPGPQYVALGHIHAPQAIPGSPVPGQYAGSLLPLDFGEAGETKRVVIEQRSQQAGGSSPSNGAGLGTTVGARRAPEPREIDPRATLVHAATRGRSAEIRIEDLHERIRAPIAGTRYLFVVDSSGSHAVQERMRLVKGAVNGLLDAAHGRRDEVVVIACRGAAAAVLVEPTPSLADAQRALEYMPTGGRTPLAHALELAATYVTAATVAILVTDGHANVPSRTDDPWADTLAAASAIGCPSVVVDSEDTRQPTGKPRELADVMRGTYVRLAEHGCLIQVRVVREMA
jgi:magnesium chelatase subunit D